MYSDKLNEALKLCTTTEAVPTVIKEVLLELVQQTQEAKVQASSMGTSTEKKCRCGKATRKE